MVSNPKAPVKWYKEKLGFNALEDGYWVVAWPKGAPWKIHICQGKREPGDAGIAFYCDNLTKTVKQLNDKSVKFAQDITKEDWRDHTL